MNPVSAAGGRRAASVERDHEGADRPFVVSAWRARKRELDVVLGIAPGTGTGSGNR